MKTIKNERITLIIAQASVGVLFALTAFLFAFTGSAQAGSLVYIEPGHGGSDPGAIGVGGFYEKTINLAIGLRLNTLLQANGYPTYMSRYDDATEGRPNPYEDIHMDQANAMGAAIFISIHNNSSTDSDARGTETHYAPKSTADINFANLVQANLVQAFNGVGYNVRDRGIKPHYPNEDGGPWMITRANMPAILIEGLFVSNSQEAGLLLNPGVQQAIAQGLYNAITLTIPPPNPPVIAPIQTPFSFLYDYNNGNSRIFTMYTSGGATPSAVPKVGWTSTPGTYDANRAKITSGDYNGDGLTDSAMLYDKGNYTAELWLFLANSNNANLTPTLVWQSASFDVSRARLFSGNFRGDAKEEIGILKDLGGANTEAIVLEYNGTLVNQSSFWSSGAGNFDLSRTKIAVGNFSGDAYDDVAALYDYGNANTAAIVMQSNGTAFTNHIAWSSGPGNWDWNRTKLTGGNFNGDAYDDIAVLYDYGNANTGAIVMASNGTNLTPGIFWSSGPGNFDWNRTRIDSADFGGSANTDVAVLYDYGNANTGVISLISSGTAFTPRLVWSSGPGNFESQRAKMEGDAVAPLVYTPITVTASGSFDVKDMNNATIASLTTGQTATVGYSCGTYYLTTSTGLTRATSSYIRMVPVGASIIRVTNMAQYDRYRGVIEIRYSSISQKLWAINELDMNSYMNGMGEEPETWPGGANEPVSDAIRYQEFLKLSAVAFRSYAYDVTVKKNKHPGESFDLCNDPGSCQWYIGYARETQGGNLAAAVSATSGQVVDYGGSPVRVPYFSDCDGRTRSATEVWGGTSYPWCAGTSDADVCSGHVLRGHGVGICMNGARWRAASGWDYSSILRKYLVMDAGFGSIGNPTVRVGVFSTAP